MATMDAYRITRAALRDLQAGRPVTLTREGKAIAAPRSLPLRPHFNPTVELAPGESALVKSPNLVEQDQSLLAFAGHWNPGWGLPALSPRIKTDSSGYAGYALGMTWSVQKSLD